MVKNYLKTAIRSILRYKAFTFINIVGLTTGLATTIFIFLWVQDELRYDRFHNNGDRIYRVMSNFTFSDGHIQTAWSTPMKLGETLLSEIPEVEHVVRMTWDQRQLFRYNDRAFHEKGYYADSSLFSMFTFPIVKGDPNNPLPDISSVAVSERFVQKYLGDEDPIGKVFRLSENTDVKVTAVFSDIPENSTLKFDFILPYQVWEKHHPRDLEQWGNNNMQTFVSLKAEADLEQVNAKVGEIVKKHCTDCISNPFLFPYSDIKLYSRFENGKPTGGGRIDLVAAFSMTALIVLLIACINFMNLATARSATRSREVGIRKVIGAKRTGLMAQFLGESILLSCTALIFALAVVQLMLPFFNSITEKNIHLDFTDPVFIVGIIIITLLCGLTAGSYPAFFLSSFKPVMVLKAQAQSVLSGSGLRRSLVVIQFSISVILIVLSLVINDQISFIQNINLGFEKENVVVLDQPGSAYQDQQTYRNEMLQHPSIKRVGISGFDPFNVGNETTDPIWPGKPDGAEISFKVIMCDYEYIPTLGMEILEGRNFSDDFRKDSSNYLINEKAMEVMGLTRENVIGTSIDMWQGKGQIIGLVKDFNNVRLNRPIEPLIFLYAPQNTWQVFVKVDGNVDEALAHIASIHKKFAPGYPFEYGFLDDRFKGEYKTEDVVGKLSKSFTVVAILISCLGLLGLASFTAERRIKELGIRKILGASVTNLVIMLCNDFTRLVLIGLCIGMPAAWYLSKMFLSQYVFHTNLDTSIFMFTTISVITVSILTVLYQAVNAAISNPVNSLRNE